MPLDPAPARASYRLFRVDDRLLHGQVALAWGRQLSPRHFLLADDRLAVDAEAARIFALCAPEGCDVSIASIESLLRGNGDLPEPASSVLLVRGLAEAARLLRGGVPGPVNLGGIHAHPGARQVFPYLFLTPPEESLVAALLAEGHALFAQDLPQNTKRDAGDWLRLSAGSARSE